MSTRFLYYFFLCLCKTLKDRKKYTLLLGKRVQRYDYFPNYQNFFDIFFVIHTKKF